MKRNLCHICLITAGFLNTGNLQSAPNPDGHVHEPVTAQNKPVPSTPQHRHGRGPKAVVLSISDDASVRLWKPDLSTQPLELKDGKVTLPATGVDNYHAIVAEKVRDTVTEATIRYEYARGKPSGHSSTELTATNKTILEIVPDPIPREHYRYLSGSSWEFLVRYREQPLANQIVSLNTSYGSHVEAISAADGRVTMRIPDDFPDMKEGERDKRQAEFVVTTKYAEDDYTYFTSLNAAYRVNPGHWQSLEMGLAVVGLGMLAGGVIGRVGRSANKRKAS